MILIQVERNLPQCNQCLQVQKHRETMEACRLPVSPQKKKKKKIRIKQKRKLKRVLKMESDRDEASRSPKSHQSSKCERTNCILILHFLPLSTNQNPIHFIAESFKGKSKSLCTASWAVLTISGNSVVSASAVTGASTSVALVRTFLLAIFRPIKKTKAIF